MGAPQEQIDGRTYSFGMMPAETSFLISLRIIKQLGETGFRLLIEFASQEADAQGLTIAKLMAILVARGRDGDGVMKAIAGALATMDPNEYLAITRTIFENVTVEKTPGGGNGSHAPLNSMFDAIFRGRPKLVWKVLLPALKENYRDFAEGLDSPSSQPPPSTT